MRGSAALFLLLALLTGCSAAESKESTADYAVFTDGPEPFRTQFNADAGKVRVVQLVAPS